MYLILFISWLVAMSLIIIFFKKKNKCIKNDTQIIQNNVIIDNDSLREKREMELLLRLRLETEQQLKQIDINTLDSIIQLYQED